MHDHRQVMTDLAIEKGWQRGIELGLGSGQLFGRMLGLGVRMIGVDMGARPDRRAKIEAMQSDPELLQHVETVYWMTTNQAAPLVPDGWADFVFIDAAHSYEAVRDDIRLWAPKVREGGWLGGHDYHPSWPGVVRAVDEAFRNRLTLLDGYIWARAGQ
jgi:hypothetical protein